MALDETDIWNCVETPYPTILSYILSKSVSILIQLFSFLCVFSLFLDGLSGTNWTGGLNFVLVLSFAVQWNGLTAEVSVMPSSFLFEMC